MSREDEISNKKKPRANVQNMRKKNNSYVRVKLQMDCLANFKTK